MYYYQNCLEKEKIKIVRKKLATCFSDWNFDRKYFRIVKEICCTLLFLSGILKNLIEFLSNLVNSFETQISKYMAKDFLQNFGQNSGE